MTTLSTAADLLALNKRRFKIVEGFGLTLRIRSLNEREKSEYQAKTFTDKGYSPERARGQRRRLIIACVVDADGNLMMTDRQADELLEVDGGVTDWLYGECYTHCWPSPTIEDADNRSDGADAQQ